MTIARKSDGYLQIRYVKSSHVGIVIEELKGTHPNLSQMIRDYILFIKGYEVLSKKQDVSKKELQEICLKNLQFFIAQTEITKINLQQEKQNYNYQFQEEKLISNQEPKLSKSQEPKPIKNTISKDLSLINSLLPN